MATRGTNGDHRGPPLRALRTTRAAHAHRKEGNLVQGERVTDLGSGVSRSPGDEWEVRREGWQLGWEAACRQVERALGTTVPQRVKSAWEDEWQTWANAQSRVPNLSPTPRTNLPSGVTSPRDQGDTVAGQDGVVGTHV